MQQGEAYFLPSMKCSAVILQTPPACASSCTGRTIARVIADQISF